MLNVQSKIYVICNTKAIYYFPFYCFSVSIYIYIFSRFYFPHVYFIHTKKTEREQNSIVFNIQYSNESNIEFKLYSFFCSINFSYQFSLKFKSLNSKFGIGPIIKYHQSSIFNKCIKSSVENSMKSLWDRKKHFYDNPWQLTIPHLNNK